MVQTPQEFADQHSDVIASVEDRTNSAGRFLTFYGHKVGDKSPSYGVHIPPHTDDLDVESCLYKPALQALKCGRVKYQVEGKLGLAYAHDEIQSAVAALDSLLAPASKLRIPVVQWLLDCEMASEPGPRRTSFQSLRLALGGGVSTAINRAFNS